MQALSPESRVPSPALQSQRLVSRVSNPESRGSDKLWLCICLPRLGTDVFGVDSDLPLVITETVRGCDLIHACSEEAEKYGIRVGMPLAAALALCGKLQYRSRDERAECAMVNEVAVAACHFSAQVGIRGGDNILLEIRASLKLFKGLKNLLRQVEEACDQCGAHFAFAIAPTCRAAGWLARHAPGSYVLLREQLAGALRQLPVQALVNDTGLSQRLRRSGIQTVGALLRLPRGGSARRFGPALLEQLDQALGYMADPLPLFSPPPAFQAVEELYPPPADWTRLQPVAAPLLQRLEHYLLRQQAATRRVLCRLRHEHAPATMIELNTSRYERRAVVLLDLLQKWFERTPLPAAVTGLEIHCEHIHVIPPGNLGLLDDFGAVEGHWQQLCDQLAARLGRERLSKPVLRRDHRPEKAAGDGLLKSGEALRVSGSPSELSKLSPRPLWLLQRPQSLRTVRGRPDWGGPLTLLPGPERVEQGWWDGMDVSRDYYQARNRAGSGLWLFQDRRNRQWYLHGVFA